MFDEMRKGLQQIEFIKQPGAGELMIGSSIVTDAGLLPAIIERFSQDFRNSGLEPLLATVLTISLRLYMRMVATGRWLGLVPASVMRFRAKEMRLKVLPVHISSPPAPVGFITIKDRTITPLGERFIDYARNVPGSDSRY